jgi:branched-chain amino acid transport system ATP-binding protein
MGLAIPVIDENLEVLFSIAEKHYIMEKIRVVWSGGTADLRGSYSLKVRSLRV